MINSKLTKFNVEDRRRFYDNFQLTKIMPREDTSKNSRLSPQMRKWYQKLDERTSEDSGGTDTMAKKQSLNYNYFLTPIFLMLLILPFHHYYQSNYYCFELIINACPKKPSLYSVFQTLFFLIPPICAFIAFGLVEDKSNSKSMILGSILGFFFFFFYGIISFLS